MRARCGNRRTGRQAQLCLALNRTASWLLRAAHSQMGLPAGSTATGRKHVAEFAIGGMMRMGEWRYNSKHPQPRQRLEVSGNLHAPAALDLVKVFPNVSERAPEPV